MHVGSTLSAATLSVHRVLLSSPSDLYAGHGGQPWQQHIPGRSYGDKKVDKVSLIDTLNANTL